MALNGKWSIRQPDCSGYFNLMKLSPNGSVYWRKHIITDDGEFAVGHRVEPLRTTDDVIVTLFAFASAGTPIRVARVSKCGSRVWIYEDARVPSFPFGHRTIDSDSTGDVLAVLTDDITTGVDRLTSAGAFDSNFVTGLAFGATVICIGTDIVYHYSSTLVRRLADGTLVWSVSPAYDGYIQCVEHDGHILTAVIESGLAANRVEKRSGTTGALLDFRNFAPDTVAAVSAAGEKYFIALNDEFLCTDENLNTLWSVPGFHVPYCVYANEDAIFWGGAPWPFTVDDEEVTSSIVATDHDGNIIWTRLWSRTTGTHAVYGLCESEAGAIYAIGSEAVPDCGSLQVADAACGPMCLDIEPGGVTDDACTDCSDFNVAVELQRAADECLWLSTDYSSGFCVSYAGGTAGRWAIARDIETGRWTLSYLVYSGSTLVGTLVNYIVDDPDTMFPKTFTLDDFSDACANWPTEINVRTCPGDAEYGACCQDDDSVGVGICGDTTQETCLAIGGTWLGAGTTCCGRACTDCADSNSVARLVVTVVSTGATHDFVWDAVDGRWECPDDIGGLSGPWWISCGGLCDVGEFRLEDSSSVITACILAPGENFIVGEEETQIWRMDWNGCQ